MLAPFAPHLAEELWQKLGHDRSLASASWPSWDEEVTRDAWIDIPVQVMGKVRGRITVPADADRAVMEAAALSDAKIQIYTAGKTILRVVTVPGKMVNIVTS
jgi:leucyl-tRNA synthetase